MSEVASGITEPGRQIAVLGQDAVGPRHAIAKLEQRRWPRLRRGSAMHDNSVETAPNRPDPEHSLLMWLALLTQTILVSIAFPIRQLVTQTPLLHIDAPFHRYQIEIAKALAQAGHTSGYDPYLAAGYVGGIAFNASAKIPALLAILFSPWVSTAVVYKFFVFGVAVLASACVPLAARWVKLSTAASIAATIFAILLWWLSALRWFHTAGMVSYVFAAYLALPYAALLFRYLIGPRRWPFVILLAGVGNFGFFLHPLFPLLVGPLTIALTLAHWREISPGRMVIVYLVVPLLCLLPNLVWILPTLWYPSFAVLSPKPYQSMVGLSIIWNEALGRITALTRGARLNIVLWCAILCVLALPMQPREKRTAIALAGASAILIIFAALGAALPYVSILEPNRFSSAAYLYLCIPAGLGVAAVFERLPQSKGFPRLVLFGSAAFFALASAFFARELSRELSYADIPHHGQRPPEVRGIGPISAWLLEWLKDNTSADARILFEMSAGRIHDHAHVAAYLAFASNREFVGGPYPYTLFANFWDGYVLGKPIDSFSPQKFDAVLRLYNIGWIVVFSESAKRFLDEMPGVTPGERFGPIQTYAVAGPHSFFLEGFGIVVSRSFNRIELAELSGSSVVLKYHYVSSLESVPPARLEAAPVPDDPEPFIRITDPPPRLILRMRD